MSISQAEQRVTRFVPVNLGVYISLIMSGGFELDAGGPYILAAHSLSSDFIFLRCSVKQLK